MEHKIYHGKVTPNDIAQVLFAKFHQGNFQVRKFQSGEQLNLQIATSAVPASGGRTNVTIFLDPIEDGVSVSVSKQIMIGVAASIGYTALRAIKNPLSILGRIDDLAQDFESLQLVSIIWDTIDRYAKSKGASTELSERFRRMACHFCQTANPVGEANCLACGAPLGEIQPVTCKKCGFLLKHNETDCPNCGYKTVI
jgi:RNA polymerase subunit RPABC4/transcription elongation factor Spt4